MAFDPILYSEIVKARKAAESGGGGGVNQVELTASADFAQNEGVAVTSAGAIKSSSILNKIEELGLNNLQTYVAFGHDKVLIHYYNSTTQINVKCWDINAAGELSNEQGITLPASAAQSGPTYKPLMEALSTPDKFILSYRQDNSNNTRIVVLDVSSGITFGTFTTVFNPFKVLNIDLVNDKILVRDNTNQFSVYDIDTVNNTLVFNHTDTSVPSLPSPSGGSSALYDTVFYDGNLYLIDNSNTIKVYRETSPQQWTVDATFSVPSGIVAARSQLRLRSNGDLLIFDEAKGENDNSRYAIVNATTGASTTPIIINYRNGSGSSFVSAIEEDSNGDHIMVAYDATRQALDYYRLNVTGSDIVSFEEIDAIQEITSDFQELQLNGSNYNSTENMAFMLGDRISFLAARGSDTSVDLEILGIPETGVVLGTAVDAVTNGNTFNLNLLPSIEGVSVIDTFTGLVPGSTYFLSEGGQVNDTAGNTLGIAISTTELLLTRVSSTRFTNNPTVSSFSVTNTLSTALSTQAGPRGSLLEGIYFLNVAPSETAAGTIITELVITSDNDAPIDLADGELIYMSSAGYIPVNIEYLQNLTVQARAQGSASKHIAFLYRDL